MVKKKMSIKTYLSLRLKDWVANLKPGYLHLPDEFSIKVCGEGTDWIQILIKSPSENAPRYFLIKVTENV